MKKAGPWDSFGNVMTWITKLYAIFKRICMIYEVGPQIIDWMKEDDEGQYHSLNLLGRLADEYAQSQARDKARFSNYKVNTTDKGVLISASVEVNQGVPPRPGKLGDGFFLDRIEHSGYDVDTHFGFDLVTIKKEKDRVFVGDRELVFVQANSHAEAQINALAKEMVPAEDAVSVNVLNAIVKSQGVLLHRSWCKKMFEDVYLLFTGTVYYGPNEEFVMYFTLRKDRLVAKLISLRAVVGDKKIFFAKLSPLGVSSKDTDSESASTNN